MDQKISAPDKGDIDYIARMLIMAQDLFFEFSNRKHTYSKDDLKVLQAIIDSKKIEKEATLILQALGLFFGKIFIENNEDYDWWMVEDEYGRDPGIRYKETSLIVFPQTMISKRIEDSEEIKIEELYNDLLQMLEDIKSEHYEGG